MVWASYSQFQQAVRTRKKQFVCLCHAQHTVSTTSHNQFELVSTTRKNQFWASHNQFQSQGKMVWASYSQFQQAVRTRKNQFELVTASSITRKNRSEPVFWGTCLFVSCKTASFNNQSQPVWVSHSQFQQPVTTRLSEFQQPGRTSFELVTTSFNHKEKLDWANYSQFQQAVRTRKNQFELVTTSSMTRKNLSELVFWGTCLFVSCKTASFNNQEEPVSASHSQFQWQGKTGLS